MSNFTSNLNMTQSIRDCRPYVMLSKPWYHTRKTIASSFQLIFRPVRSEVPIQARIYRSGRWELRESHGQKYHGRKMPVFQLGLHVRPRPSLNTRYSGGTIPQLLCYMVEISGLLDRESVKYAFQPISSAETKVP